MKEMIGKVTLNDKFYKGEDLYNDGDDIENEMLEIAKAGNWQEVLHKSRKRSRRLGQEELSLWIMFLEQLLELCQH